MWLCRVKAANDTSVVANVMMNEDSLLQVFQSPGNRAEEKMKQS